MTDANAASKARGEQLRRKRASRVARVRRRIAGTSLVTFAVTWGVIAGAGSQGATARTTGSVASRSGAVVSSIGSSSSSSSTTIGSDRSSTQATVPSAVTTRQS